MSVPDCELYSPDWQCYCEVALISPSLLSSPSSVSMFCDFSSSSSYRRLEMSCLISFSSPEKERRHEREVETKSVKIHVCHSVDFTFSDLVTLFVCLGFDDVTLYQPLHDLLQSVIYEYS